MRSLSETTRSGVEQVVGGAGLGSDHDNDDTDELLISNHTSPRQLNGQHKHTRQHLRAPTRRSARSQGLVSAQWPCFAYSLIIIDAIHNSNPIIIQVVRCIHQCIRTSIISNTIFNGSSGRPFQSLCAIVKIYNIHFTISSTMAFPSDDAYTRCPTDTSFAECRSDLAK